MSAMWSSSSRPPQTQPPPSGSSGERSTSLDTSSIMNNATANFNNATANFNNAKANFNTSSSTAPGRSQRRRHGHGSHRHRSSSDGVYLMQQQRTTAIPSGYSHRLLPPQSFVTPPSDDILNPADVTRTSSAGSFDATQKRHRQHLVKSVSESGGLLVVPSIHTGQTSASLRGYGAMATPNMPQNTHFHYSLRPVTSSHATNTLQQWQMQQMMQQQIMTMQQQHQQQQQQQPQQPIATFSKFNELSSIMVGSTSSRSLRSKQSASNSNSTTNKRNFHRRTMSDSDARSRPVEIPPTKHVLFTPLSPLQQGKSFTGYPFPSLSPSNTTSSSAAAQVPMSTLYDTNRIEYNGQGQSPETDALLEQAMRATAATGSMRAKPRTHMRQSSVNIYMNKYRGKEQPRSCRDPLFALLFLLQLLVMALLGWQYGPEALVATSAELGPGQGLKDSQDTISTMTTRMDDDRNNDYDDDVERDSDALFSEGDGQETVVLAYWNIIKMAYTCGAFVCVISACALAFMMTMSRRLIYVALVLSIGVSFAWGTIGIGISPKSFVPITGIISLMLTVGYMFVVWDRIPFASANLTTALSGVRDNLGLVCIAFECQFLALVCSIYYSFTFVGLHNAIYNGGVDISENGKVLVEILLLLSYYWTYQVLRHIVIVTVAGTIGSWWFKRPSALYPTFLQATFFNFGSICYGSLFVGFVQLLRQLTEGLRPNRNDSAMMCLYECSVLFQEKIVNCVDDLADSFTPWAFTYVGLYRYGLREAGHKANELFEKRGWSRIVTDDLVPTVLTMVSLVIGGLSGCFAVILQALDGHGLTSFGHPVLVSFAIGFLIGIVLSTVLFSIISSSVAAVIVCFAGSPVEFHNNYPELSNEMRHAWREVWPGSLDIGSVGGLDWGE